MAQHAGNVQGPVGFPGLSFEDILSKLQTGPGINTDISSVNPTTGEVKLHSDAPSLQLALENAVQGQPSAPGLGQAQIAQTGAPLTNTPAQQQGGLQEFLSQPGFISALGKLGTIISGGSNTFGGQLGQFATQGAEAQLFNQMLQQMLSRGGGQNPSIPSSSLGFLGVEGLSPELQSQAFQLSQNQQQLDLASLLGAREIQSADVNDVFTVARTLAALSPDLPDAQGRKEIRLGLRPDGTAMPPGQDFAYSVDLQTGEVIPIGEGKRPAPSTTTRKRPSLDAANRKEIKVGILSQFADVIQEGLDRLGGITDPKTGKKILRAGLLLNLLRDPQGQLDIDAVILAISQVSELSGEFDVRLEGALAELDADVPIGTVLRNVRKLGTVKFTPIKTGFSQ